MDKKIEKIIEICGFRNDPYWNDIEKIFSDVTFKQYNKILKNKNNLILDKISSLNTFTGAKATIVKTLEEFKEHITIDKKNSMLSIRDPILVKTKINIPECALHINAPAYLGEGTSMIDSRIDDIAWIEPNAKIEYSNIQPGNGYCFVGSNTIVSNVNEIKGTFISGGPLRKEGRSQIYMHAFAAINMIIGAYSAPSIGLTVYNHPLGDDSSIVIDPETYKPHKFPQSKDNRKLAVLLGYEAELGANVLLNSGTIIGSKATVPSQSNIDGMVYLDKNNTATYICARKAAQLNTIQ